MGYTTVKGLPVPFGFEGNNVPVDLKALADRIESMLSPKNYADIEAFTGGDLWDSRIVFQVDSGALRPFIGFYVYRGSGQTWEPLVSMGTPPGWNTQVAYSTSVGGESFTGATITSKLQRFGPLVLGNFSFTFPGTVANFGSGSVQFALPYVVSSTPDSTEQIGWGQFIDASTSARRTYDFVALPGGSIGFFAQTNSSTPTVSASGTNPINLAVNDRFIARMAYFTDQT